MSFIPMYDLESLNEAQRQDYIKAVCQHMGVPDNLNLVALTYVDDGEGPARLVAYAKRGATENIRQRLEIDIVSLTNQVVNGSIVFTATAKSKLSGRQEISTGSKWIDGLRGTELDDAIMTAQTRALRRVTLQFMGAGVLDESEVVSRKIIHTASAPQPVPAQPIAAPTNEPGKDITPEPTVAETPVVDAITGQRWATQEEFEKFQDKLRADAIATLNASKPAVESQIVDIPGTQTVEVPAKKTRKPRGPNKKKIDLGPSEPVPAATVAEKKPEAVAAHAPTTATVDPNTAAVMTTPAPEQATVVAQPATLAAPPPAPVKPKLPKDVVTPFRQRLFAVVNRMELEGGFAPKDGMGNSDKMRSLAQIMFAGVTNMNDLTVENWNQYLAVLETKMANEGPAATAKYVEETIGI